MKKTLKKIFAGVSAVSVLATGFLTVSAASYTIYDYPVYMEYVEENYQRFSKEKEEEMLKNNPQIKDIFYSFDNTEDIYYLYCINAFNNECYEYTYTMVYWKDFYMLSAETELPSEEEINTFLSENNLKAKVGEYQPTEYDYHRTDVRLEYDENITFEEVQTVIDALENKFGLYVKAINPCSFSIRNNFAEEQATEDTEPTINFGTATIAGDLDLNDEQGISDIVALTKYTASPELYPITDPTALANADINKDGTIDSVDTSILVEIMLGTYESAV